MFSLSFGWPLFRVSPVNIYSKLFISANCEYDASQGNETSNFCPGYYAATKTPYPGTKENKLQEMSDVFCTYCSNDDATCLQLFCAPDRLIVSVAMTMMSSFCDDIQNTFPSCHSEFCPSSFKKRQANQNTDRIGTSNECFATSDWMSVPGIDQWCQSNCKEGNDPVSCPESYCHCPEVKETTTTAAVTSVSANNLGSGCLQWEASVIWAHVPGMDPWCQRTCSSAGYCPETHCQCKENLLDSTTQSTSTSTIKFSSSSTPTSSTLSSSTSTYSTKTTTSTSTTPTTTSSTTTISPTTSTTTSTRSTSSTTSPTTSSSTSTTTTTTSSPSSTTSTTSTTTSTSSPSSTTSTTSTSTTTSAPSTTPSTTTPPRTTTSTTTSTSSITSPSTTSPSTTTTISSTTSKTITLSTTLSSTTTSTPSTTSSTTTTTPSSSTTTTKSTISTSPSTTSPSTTTKPSMTTSTRTTKPSTTRTTLNSATSSETNTPALTSSISVSSGTVSTTAAPTMNVTDADSQGVVSQIVCEHANTLYHNVLTDRYCNQQESNDFTGYNIEILDQVLSFAPKILCALTSTAKRGDTCPSMFCGESPLSQQLVKSSLCSVCQQFSETLAPSCAVAYCS